MGGCRGDCGVEREEKKRERRRREGERRTAAAAEKIKEKKRRISKNPKIPSTPLVPLEGI